MKLALTFDDVQINPRYSEIESRKDCNVESRFTRNYSIGIPIASSPMDSVTGIHMIEAMYNAQGVGCLHRFMPIDEQGGIIRTCLKYFQRIEYPLVATIGATGDYQQRAEVSLNSGANVLLIDVAHGDHIHVKRALAWLNSLSNRRSFDVIAGNVATAGGALRLQDWGADAIRVGIGGGSMCETRMRTGIGIPQLTAITDAASVIDIPIIADGGIRSPGDVAKALAAGADTVMIGSLFSGTTEAPGDVFVTGQWPREKTMKVYRGSASAAAKFSVKGAADYVEGTAKMVPSKGSVTNVVSTILDGVRSSMSYVGARTLDEFRMKAEFIQITNAGLAEAHPHGLNA